MSSEYADSINRANLLHYPFRHLIIDDFLPSQLFQQVVKEALSVDLRRNYGIAKDKRCEYRKVAFFPHVVGSIFNQTAINLSSPEVVNSMGAKFSYPRLVGDPTYYGGGLHMTTQGGFLGIHRDFNIHHLLKLQRVLNLILFLNLNWQDHYGGHLILQDSPRSSEKVEILPCANKAVIFDTAAHNSYHGQPSPLNTPFGTNRLSLALYYYQSFDTNSIQSRGTDFADLVRPY